jgi:hypothetical protein
VVLAEFFKKSFAPKHHWFIGGILFSFVYG